MQKRMDLLFKVLMALLVVLTVLSLMNSMLFIRIALNSADYSTFEKALRSIIYLLIGLVPAGIFLLVFRSYGARKKQIDFEILSEQNATCDYCGGKTSKDKINCQFCGSALKR